jgi:regulator of PEP synthase PpsR (kinase-PPPase family)
VLALEAQFPDTEFEVVRHPRVESVDDLQLAISRTSDRPAVIVYTLVDTELRETMHALCTRDGLHCCDLLGSRSEEVAIVSGRAARMESGRKPPLDSQYFKRWPRSSSR